ncbi:MAG: tetratricopeptide (TPR) repeat protein [Gammaproteobacteria bacterium]|jgi:tetratricopeptide (TPR) repeat protein
MPPETTPPTNAHWIWVVPTLALAVLVAFWPNLTGNFVYDDLTLVAQDPMLRSLGNATELVSKPLWSGLPGLSDAEAGAIGHWRPLTSLSLALGFALGGSAQSTLPFHLLSLLFHLLASLAAFSLAKRLFANHEHGTVAALFVALLFAVHPVHVESVSWISAINDPLFGLFALVSLGAWLKWRDDGSEGLPLLAAGAFLCALLSKEQALGLLPIVLVFELVTREQPKRAARGWLALLGVVALWYFMRAAVFGEAMAGFGRGGESSGDLARDLMLRVEMLGGGMYHLLDPTDLSPFRPFRNPVPDGDALHQVQMIGALVLALGLGFAFLARDSMSKLGLLLLPAGMLPVLIYTSGLGQTPYADRYLYLPVLGISLVIAHFAFRVLPKVAAIGALTVVVCVFGRLTMLQSATWNDQETLFSTAIEKNPDYTMLYWQLGEIRRQNYLQTMEPAELKAAFAMFDSATDLLVLARTDESIPKSELDHLQTSLGQAWCYLHQADGDEFKDFETPRTIFNMLLEKVYQREQFNADNGFNRAMLPLEQIFCGLGVCAVAMGDPDEAIAHFKRALEFNPNFAPATHNLGIVYFDQQQWELSRQMLERTLELKPDDTDVMAYLARSLFEAGWPDSALEVAARIAELDPGSPVPKVLEGSAAFKKRDWSKALAAFDQALVLDPRDAFSHYRRGMTLYQMDLIESAIKALRRSCELSPTHFESHYNLGSFLLANGSESIAQPYLDRAYSIGGDPRSLAAMREALYALDMTNDERLHAFAALDDQRKDAAGALWWAERSLLANPANGMSRHLKGRILLDSNEFTLALPELEMAVKIYPNGIGPVIDLGRCYGKVGKPELAMENFDRALQLIQAQRAPSDPEQLEGFRTLQQNMREKVEALRNAL